MRSALVTDHWLGIRMLAEKLHKDKETVRKIITEDLGKKKLCVRFVLYVLTVEQQEDHVISYQDPLEMSNNNPKFSSKTVTGNESGVLPTIQKGNGKLQLWLAQIRQKRRNFTFRSCATKQYWSLSSILET